MKYYSVVSTASEVYCHAAVTVSTCLLERRVLSRKKLRWIISPKMDQSLSLQHRKVTRWFSDSKTNANDFTLRLTSFMRSAKKLESFWYKVP